VDAASPYGRDPDHGAARAASPTVILGRGGRCLSGGVSGDGFLELFIPCAIGRVARDLVDGVVVEERGVVLHALVARQDEPLPELEDALELIIGHRLEIGRAGNDRVQVAPSGGTPQ